MPQEFEPGDYLVFQLESGFALVRVLEVEIRDELPVWHLTAYSNLFLDTESAEYAIQGDSLTVEIPHTAITNRAFESTQVARLGYKPLAQKELQPLDDWRSDAEQRVHDRSIRLLLGLR